VSVSGTPDPVTFKHVAPYTAADPTGFRKGSQWDYYSGLTVKSFNLTPGSSTEAQVITTNYDFADRPLQVTRPDGGWVKTAYWDNWLVKVTSQLIETGKTRYKFEEYDGAGRVRRKSNDHPDGVAGKFSGQVFVFDKLGRTEDSSNVIAINGSWVPSHEDASTGFLFTHLTRDELNRLKVVTFPDGNVRQYNFEGCGCVGNSETRITDELGHYTITKTDFLGRLIETVEPDSPVFGGGGVYSKATYLYDALDRLVRMDHADTTGAKIQSRTFTYDGYGRLSQENTPEGGVVNYTYTANDLRLTKTDARNITTTFSYNTRNLMTGVSYSDGTPGVTSTYDDFGSKQAMTDGEGGTNYVYNSFRQLQSETRTFTALTGKQHTLNYTYNLADQPKSVNYVVSSSSASLTMPSPVEMLRGVSAQVPALDQFDEEGSGKSLGGETSTSVSAAMLKSGQSVRLRHPSTKMAAPKIARVVLSRVVPPSAAQDFYISGNVSTAQGAGIQGVNVTVTGPPFGPYSAVTASNGNYTVTQSPPYLPGPGYIYTVTVSLRLVGVT